MLSFSPNSQQQNIQNLHRSKHLQNKDSILFKTLLYGSCILYPNKNQIRSLPFPISEIRRKHMKPINIPHFSLKSEYLEKSRNYFNKNETSYICHRIRDTAHILKCSPNRRKEISL